MFSCFSLRTVLHQRNVNAGVTKCRKRTISHVKGSSCNVQDRWIFIPGPRCLPHASLMLLSCRNITGKSQSANMFFDFSLLWICIWLHLSLCICIWSPERVSQVVAGQWLPVRKVSDCSWKRTLLVANLLTTATSAFLSAAVLLSSNLPRKNIIESSLPFYDFNVTVSKCQEDRLAICICCVLWALEIFRNLDWNVVYLGRHEMCACSKIPSLFSGKERSSHRIFRAADSPLIKHC